MAVKTLLETCHQQVFWCLCSLSSFEAVGFECLLRCPNNFLTICLRNMHLGGKIPIVTPSILTFTVNSDLSVFCLTVLCVWSNGRGNQNQTICWNLKHPCWNYRMSCTLHLKKRDHEKADRSTCCLLQKIERQRKNVYACNRKKGR